MKDLSRLFRLSKKTGDRLIVHDTGTDESFVIMDIDEYEFLAVRDIEEDNEESNEDDEIDDWYHAKDVIEDRYGAAYESAHHTGVYNNDIYNKEEKKIAGGEEDFFTERPNTLDFDDEPSMASNASSASSHQTDEKKAEPTLHEIPFEPTRQEIANQWKEEPLRDDDEPVFFEEPV